MELSDTGVYLEQASCIADDISAYSANKNLEEFTIHEVSDAETRIGKIIKLLDR